MTNYTNIMGWHSHKNDTPHTFGSGDKFVGIEMEIDRNNLVGELEHQYVDDLNEDIPEHEEYINAPNRVIKGINSKYAGHFYYETDGSLVNGFEIISEPHSEIEMSKIDWEYITDVCKNNGYISHDAGTCGLHLHFSRTWLGENEYKQTMALNKLLAVYDIYWPVFVKLSRRNFDQIDDYASSYNTDLLSKVEKDAKAAVAEAVSKSITKKGLVNSWYGRYKAINLCNEKTIEFRLGRGTLDPVTLKNWIDLHITLVKNATRIPWGKVGDLKAWLKGCNIGVREMLIDKYQKIYGTPQYINDDPMAMFSYICGAIRMETVEE